MAKTKKQPERRPVKGKGIPAPRQAPPRSAMAPLYRRRWAQAVAVLALLAIVAAVVWGVLDSRKEERQARRAVDRFDKSLQLATTESPTVFQEMQASPAAFLNGSLSTEEYAAQADAWVAYLQGLHQKIAETNPPANLENIRNLFADGTLVYIDAAKSFRFAADLQEPSAREQAVQQGYNLIAHANGVFGAAQRLFAQVKLDTGVSQDEPVLQQPPQPAPEEVPIPQEPQQPPGGQGQQP